MSDKINKVVILGGGTAGWMTAAALARMLPSLNITLIESEQIGTIGVGEATIPTIQFFNGILGLDPNEFIKRTNGTYKLGINFENWTQNNHEYFHAFGSTGQSLWAAGFHDFWTKGKKLGIAKDLSAYNFEATAAKLGKFDKTSNGLNYAYHLDAGLYAKMLREIAQESGVKRIEGKVTDVQQNPLNSYVTSLNINDGQAIHCELFIDCSGFAGILIDKTLKTPFVDWMDLLPCDRAIAVLTESVNEPSPYTRSIAHHAGWQWRIPLQHRVGNGIVYCSQFMSDEEAKQLLFSTIEGNPLTEPRVIQFKTGYREKLWNKNVVAVGLAGGFIEPLESTAIHIIQQGIQRLIKLFPSQGIDESDIAEYNRSGKTDYEQIKDFIVLHYKQTFRDDSPFWRHCRNMEIPDSLAKRIEMFKTTGRFVQRQQELFVDSWLQVMIGQGIIPDKYSRLADKMDDYQLQQFLTRIERETQRRAESLPTHNEYIHKHCKSKTG